MCEGCDIQGRKYLTREEAKPGVRVQVDGDFTCIGDGELRELKADAEGCVYFECNEGEPEPLHYLDGSEADDGDYYIGVYRVAA